MSFHKNIGFIKDEYYFMSDCFFINRSKYISSYFCIRYLGDSVDSVFVI